MTSIRRAGGFTLVEMLISVGIASVLMVAVLAVTLTGIQSSTQSRAGSLLSNDVVLLTDFFSREFPNTGGNVIPVDGSIFVENNCSARATFPGCQGSDRVSLFQAIGDLNCPILATAGWSPSAGVIQLDTTGGCCLPGVSLTNYHAMFVKKTFFQHMYITATDPAACQVTYTAGPVLPGFDNPYAGNDWSSGAIVPMQVKTYFLDTTTTPPYVLNRLTYTNGGASSTTSTTEALIDRLFDFQVALGYDFNPADGNVSDTGDNNDEWLYNALPTESFLALPFTAASPSQLRMVGIGFIAGSPVTNKIRGQWAAVLDGKLWKTSGIATSDIPSAVTAFRVGSTYNASIPNGWTVQGVVLNTMLRNTGNYQ
jgi:prepilin-type N-terminal cleavage/methylation domain-containing protein